MSRVSFVGLLVGLVARVCGLGSLVGLVKLIVVPFLCLRIGLVGLVYWLNLLVWLIG